MRRWRAGKLGSASSARRTLLNGDVIYCWVSLPFVLSFSLSLSLSYILLLKKEMAVTEK